MSAPETSPQFSPRALKAKELFEQGYNCAQATALAFADEIGLDPQTIAKLASPFGGGMARMREVCGTISGAFLAYGAIRGTSDPKDAAKVAVYKEMQALAESFRQENGSIICRELLGLGDPPAAGPDQARKPKRPCGELVAMSTQLLEEILKKSN
ncbi:MAG: C_GCAxxG_C_C family protein [Thermoguttaceae bacterium]|nr:C_GCAxxG_C_C family protein [Thermoguttaceae bacterium]